MPFHVGSFKVPTFRLARLTLDLGKIFDEYGKDIITSPTTNEMLAHTVLGYKGSESGQYHEELTSLNTYRLLEGYKHVRISKLGLSILRYSENKVENLTAYRTAALSIPLWGALFNQFGLKVHAQPPNVVKGWLEDNAGWPRRKNDMDFDSIVKAYDDDTSPIRTIGRTVVIEVTAGKRHYIQPFSEHGRDRTIKWLKKVNIKKTPS